MPFVYTVKRGQSNKLSYLLREQGVTVGFKTLKVGPTQQWRLYAHGSILQGTNGAGNHRVVLGEFLIQPMHIAVKPVVSFVDDVHGKSNGGCRIEQGNDGQVTSEEIYPSAVGRSVGVLRLACRSPAPALGSPRFRQSEKQRLASIAREGDESNSLSLVGRFTCERVLANRPCMYAKHATELVSFMVTISIQFPQRAVDLHKGQIHAALSQCVQRTTWGVSRFQRQGDVNTQSH